MLINWLLKIEGFDVVGVTPIVVVEYRVFLGDEISMYCGSEGGGAGLVVPRGPPAPTFPPP